MLIKFPQDDKQFSWTVHIKNKMLYYGLSEQQIRKVLKSPDRVEEGVAEATSAAMKRRGTKKTPEELWVMFAERKKIRPTAGINLDSKKGRLIMISAWRYPGVTKPGASIPIPDDILAELAKIL
jgi:hypothetical protein